MTNAQLWSNEDPDIWKTDRNITFGNATYVSRHSVSQAVYLDGVGIGSVYHSDHGLKSFTNLYSFVPDTPENRIAGIGFDFSDFRCDEGFIFVEFATVQEMINFYESTLKIGK